MEGHDKLVTFHNAPNFIKLRASFHLNDRCRFEVGYDNDITQPGRGKSRPWAAVLCKLDDKESGLALEANNDFVTLNKRFDLDLRKLTVGVDAKVGLTTQGKPSVQLGLTNAPIALAAAALLLLLRKPVHLARKETGGLSINLPLCGSGGPSLSLQERAELDCTLLRRPAGGGLALDFHEINPVIRLWHDKPKPKKKACCCKK